METLKHNIKDPAFTGILWLIARVFVGYEFLTAGWEKVTSGQWIGGDGITGFLQGALGKATGAHPEVQDWYVWLTKNIFLPNATVFSTLVAIGEVAVGLALIFGVFTKFAAFWGAVMNLAFLGAGVSSASPQMLALEVAMVFGGAGVTYYAVDRVLLPYLGKVLKIKREEKPTTQTGSLPVPTPAS
jgi:thiosulfate dehydrogenase (quinone) large subunit